MLIAVIKSKRSVSKMEFLHTARELQIYTIQKVCQFPQKYAFYIGQPITNAAARIHEYVKMANSIYPANSHETQIRRDYLIRALAELNSFISQIELADEIIGLKSDVMERWVELVEKEIRMVKGLMDEDKERYKRLA